MCEHCLQPHHEPRLPSWLFEVPSAPHSRDSHSRDPHSRDKVPSKKSPLEEEVFLGRKELEEKALGLPAQVAQSALVQ